MEKKVRLEPGIQFGFDELSLLEHDELALGRIKVSKGFTQEMQKFYGKHTPNLYRDIFVSCFGKEFIYTVLDFAFSSMGDMMHLRTYRVNRDGHLRLHKNSWRQGYESSWKSMRHK